MAAAWVLNLDADLELAFGDGYRCSERTRALMAPHVERARVLLRPGDVMLGEGGDFGRAWCPTPSALATMREHGVIPEDHPPFDVLRRVNARAFSASLSTFGRFVTDLDEAIAAIGENTRLKRNFGMAGRGHRVVDRVDDGTLSYLRAAMREGGVQIEPNVRIVAEYAQHGFLTRSGSLERGRPIRQHCDAHGQWVRSEPGDRALDLDTVAEALHRAGYFGPFGIDAFDYEGGYQPLSEINARYSMGYAIGFTRS